MYGAGRGCRRRNVSDFWSAKGRKSSPAHWLLSQNLEDQSPNYELQSSYDITLPSPHTLCYHCQPSQDLVMGSWIPGVPEREPELQRPPSLDGACCSSSCPVGFWGLVGLSRACPLVPSPKSSQTKKNFLTLILATFSPSIS